jgi:hypothetical protein
MRVTTAAPDRTALLVADEVDRVKGGREQLRNTFDHGRVGKVLIEMAGIETPLARYPQLDSGIGFVREFRPLGAGEIRRLLKQGWLPPDVNLPGQPWDQETIAIIIRMTGGNFRLLHHLLTQMERILEINALQEMTKQLWKRVGNAW